MSEHKDYYSILEIESDASSEAIRARYRFLVSFYHPDINLGEEKSEYATRKMQAINEAYEVLRDPQLRAEHDRRGNFNGSHPGGRSASIDEEVAEAAYEAAGHLYEMIRSAGFWDGLTGKKMEYRDRAITQLNTVVARWPHTETALRAQCDVMMLYLDVGEDLPRASAAAKKLGKMAPETEWQDQATFVIAICHNKSGKAERAVELLSALMSKTQNFDLKAECAIAVARMRADQFLSEKDDFFAIDEYTSFLNDLNGHPLCAQALYQKARIIDSFCHRPQEAVEFYSQVVQEFPESSEAQDCPWRITYISNMN